MIYTDLTRKAMCICVRAHEGQFDKGGFPYIHHPLHLAEQMDTEEETIVALLHDVIEDTSLTFKQLKEMGFPKECIDTLKLLTHDKNTPYLEYIEKLKVNPIAVKVKLTDLRHNCNSERLCREPVEKDKERIKKYRKAIRILEDIIPDCSWR